VKGPNLSEWAVKHPSFVLFLILACAVAGLSSYFGMGRAEDPAFTIKVMVVSAQWPGATADEMQRQVADKIEEKLQETPHLDWIKTYCTPGGAFLTIQLKDTTSPKDVPDAWYQVRKKVGDIRYTLPQGVLGPFIDDEYGDVYSAIYAFTGDDFKPAELRRIADGARQRLLRVKDVDKVSLVGDRPEKVFVEFSHKKLATLGIAPQRLFDSLIRQNMVTAAGSVETATDRVYVRVDGPFDAVGRINEVPIESGGKTFRLGDIGEVRRGYEDPPQFTMRYQGNPALGLQVSMVKGGNVLQLGDALNAELARIKTDLPAGVEIHDVVFQPRVVKESVNEFQRSFAEALAIVLIVSFVSLGWRTGIVVALSVPLVIGIVLTIMSAAGMNLDRISLGALIIALGLLVDDAIIAVEMMVVKMEQGWDRVRAATFAWTSTAFPMLSGTLITVAGFLPVGFAKSSAGEYAGGIFWVVGIALVASWVVAVVFTPYLGVKLLPSLKTTPGDPHDPYQSRFYRVLRRVITWCAERPRSVVGATVLLFVAALASFGALQQQFFPQSSRPELMVELTLPQGASFSATEAEVRKVEVLLKAAPEVAQFVAYTGAGSPRFFAALNPDLPNTNFAKIVIMTKGTEAREKLRSRLQTVFASDETFALPRGRVVRLEFGPPVGFPVQFRVIGPDPARVRQLASEVRDIVRKNPKARDANLEWNEASKVLRLKIDQDRARALGLTPADVSTTMQTLLSGAPVTQYREGTRLIDVVARAIPEERTNLDTLPDLTIINATGHAVPLSQVATFGYEQEEPILWRRNRETVLTVRADVLDGNQPPDVTASILPALEPLKRTLPPGYRIEAGGDAEESEKANLALFAVFPAMVLAMFTLLMAQLQGFKRAALVFIISPLGIIGVVMALALFHAPFGFVALLGVISLAGMDMRNSIILIDQIDHDISEGKSRWEAVIEATVRRSRPVVLTAASAILAMIPLTRSVFWGPMAIAIMGGLSIATFLTLLNLPALYVMWFRVRRDEPRVAPRAGQTANGVPMHTNGAAGLAVHADAASL